MLQMDAEIGNTKSRPIGFMMPSSEGMSSAIQQNNATKHFTNESVKNNRLSDVFYEGLRNLFGL